MNSVEQASRLAALRAELERRQLAGFLVPHSDEHQSEYLPPSAERLAWISGFTGSAGMAVVGMARAALFVDGRYTLQARQQSDPALWEHRHLTDDPPEAWLRQAFGAGARIGLDPRLHTPDGLARFEAAAEQAGVVLEALADNPIDRLWTDRPPPPLSAVELYDLGEAAEPASAKRDRMAKVMARDGLAAMVVTAPDSLAWLFNIRGGDVAMTPLVLGHAVVTADGAATLFVEPAKLRPGMVEALAARWGGRFAVAAPAALAAALGGFKGGKVRLDRLTASIWVAETLRTGGATVELGDDPCALPKACKNAVELDGIRAAHRRDGLAMVRFMRWFTETAPGGETEWSAARQLDALRAEGERFRSLSFGTISASGPNGAYVHYRLDPATARALGDGELYLVDSGAQYLDGTTDVTRVLAVGTPTAEMTRRYTQVLKGHVALSRARFPAGTTGPQLDALARQFLWQDGIDYDHGTGHGVGCFLSVHEGPQGISKRFNKVPLEPGMVLSNEPGYYKAGAFGIRIENLVAVTRLDPQPPGAEREVLGFETLTLVPYDCRLIAVEMLDQDERAWIDAYHARVRDTLTPLLAPADAAWLAGATRPL